MRVIMCGDRNWTDGSAVYRELRELINTYGDRLEVIEGGARGADRLAAEACKRLKVSCIEILADWVTHGRAAGPLRNQAMLDMGAEYVVAFHSNLENSRGTRDMVNRARRNNIPVRVVTK